MADNDMNVGEAITGHGAGMVMASACISSG
jgi:hypothetical protein